MVQSTRLKSCRKRVVRALCCVVPPQEKISGQGEDGSDRCAEDQPVMLRRLFIRIRGREMAVDETHVERKSVIVIIEVFHSEARDHPSDAQIDCGDEPRRSSHPSPPWSRIGDRPGKTLGESDPWGRLRIHGDSCLCCHGMSLTMASDRLLCGDPIE